MRIIGAQEAMTILNSGSLCDNFTIAACEALMVTYQINSTLTRRLQVVEDTAPKWWCVGRGGRRMILQAYIHRTVKPTVCSI